MSAVALRAAGLNKTWGGFVANRDVSLELAVGERHALIGPNGAGKTTFINLLTGVLTPTAGDVYVGEENVTRLAQHERVARGMTRTYQITSLFPSLTVLESVVLAILEREGLATNWWKSVAQHSGAAREAKDLLERLHLGAEAGKPTKSLAYGKQRLVEIALALATKPKILLLDEPAAGIPAAQSAEVFEVIAGLPRDVTILFIEHDMQIVFRFAERVSVLVAGAMLMQGTPDEVANDARVKQVYLGEAPHD
ncbi:branched-chain amino acid ABC transporter ATP-binding protein [Betaproteobacteria bacterium GR16-43]|nr:branched-chain amino acid ABC transporter ATP-binding protein [Betaproteobacteria bacterium GR16-43]